tara:strand:- start:542 stop:868 length:327 start_codon:yes stop_codon:yes gene_type:complete
MSNEIMNTDECCEEYPNMFIESRSMRHLDPSFNLVQTNSITYYTYTLDNFQPHKSVEYTISLFNKLHQVVYLERGTIEGEEYANWGADDTYIDDLMQNKVMKMKEEGV